jgi:mono/diheme cytochrome c family protein
VDRQVAGLTITHGRLSAPVYLAGVLLLTAAAAGAAMYLRPSFAHTVRSLTGLENPRQASSNSFYVARVAPVFDQHCAGCHGERTAKAQLRLDSFDAAMRGGKHGAVVLPGNARNSELYYRMTLPSEDDKAMPPSGKQPLTRDELAVVRLWILHGASGVTLASAIKDAPRLVPPVRIPDFDPDTVSRARASQAALVRQMQTRFPGVIAYESRDSANLEVNATLLGQGFGDGDLSALAPLAGAITRLDLSGTGITDASADLLARMDLLRQLRLLGTHATDEAVRRISDLPALTSLAVGSSVTEGALFPLRKRKVVIYRGAHD